MQKFTRFITSITTETGGDGWVLIRHEQSFAMYQGNLLHDPDMARYLGDAEYQMTLGLVDDKPCRLVRVKEQIDLPGLSWHGLRGLIGHVDDSTFRLLGVAQQLDIWHETHRFCGRCGERAHVRTDERAMECHACGNRQYPKLAPCIIVLITRGEEVLLARSSTFRAGFFSTLAGFIEPGESAEEALRREVYEEVALDVRRIEYLGSQNWPFPNSLMLGFHAEYAGGEIIPQPGEIEEAHWWHVGRLPDIPPRGTISRWLIDCYLARLAGQPEPPIPA